MKRRRTTTRIQQYKRVMQQENTGEKRKENTQGEYKGTEKRTRHGEETQIDKAENNNKVENTEPEQPPKMKGKHWEEDTEERWKKYLKERDRRL